MEKRGGDDDDDSGDTGDDKGRLGGREEAVYIAFVCVFGTCTLALGMALCVTRARRNPGKGMLPRSFTECLLGGGALDTQKRSGEPVITTSAMPSMEMPAVDPLKQSYA